MEFGLSDDELKSVRRVISTFPEIEKVIIYGSRAKGTHRISSDVDISLVGRGVTFKTRSQLDIALENLTPYSFDISVFNKITDTALLAEIHKSGRIFYSK